MTLTRRSLPAVSTVVLLALTAAPAAAQQSTEPEPATTTTATSSTTTTTVSASQTPTSSSSTSSTSSSSSSSTSSTSVPKTTTTTIATTAHQITLDIAFPTDKRVGYSEGYESPRSGHIHQATDLMGQKMYKLYATVAGTACTVNGVEAAPPSWGYSISVCGEDGRKYNYLHVNNDNPGSDDQLGGPEYAFAPGIRKGVKVARGQWIGYMGDSGNAEGTAPHLHFEIEDPSIVDPYGTHKVNPYWSLQAARNRNDYPADPGMPTFDPVDRLAGADRVETATLLSQAAFPTAPHVVIASSTSVADAMAAGPLATAANGPVLITPATGLDPRVATEIRRLGATTATVMGGPTAVGPQVELDLAAAGVTTVTRIAGEDRYDTAVKAAERVWGQKAAAQRKAVIALGNHTDPARAWPDALTAGYLGSMTGAPVLLVGLTGATPGTLAALDGIASATIVGGTAAVPVPIADLVSDHLPKPATRLSGADRYATSNTVATAAVTAGASVSTVWAMTGRSPWDALAAGAAVAHLDQALVLVDGLNGSADMSISRWLVVRGASITRARIIGGTKVVNDAAAGRLARRIY